MEIEELVDRALNTARYIWFMQVVAVSALLFAYLSGWWLLLIPIYWSLSYQVTMLITGAYLARTIPVQAFAEEKQKDELAAFDEICKRIEKGTLEPGSDECNELIKQAAAELSTKLNDLPIRVVSRTSDEVIGRYLDKPIYEWIEVQEQQDGPLHRYFFETVAERKNGALVLPVIEGKVCTIMNDCVYARTEESESEGSRAAG